MGVFGVAPAEAQKTDEPKPGEQETHDPKIGVQKADALGADEYGFQLDCKPVDKSQDRLRASARGVLRMTGRDRGRNLELKGSLEITLLSDDDEPRSESVELDAFAAQDGSEFYSSTTSPTDNKIDHVYFWAGDTNSHVVAFDPSPTATIPGAYHMNCASSRSQLPQVRDLAFSYQHGSDVVTLTATTAEIAVVNEGNTDLGPTASLRIGDVIATGKLSARLAAPGEESPLKPGDEGILRIGLPSYGITRCTTYTVELDPDRTGESDFFDERAEDSKTMGTSCLRWTTPIKFESLGFEPDKLVEGATMDQIINSEVVVRTDNKVCNQCHYPGTTYSDRIDYMPPLGTKIAPNTLIDAHGTRVSGATFDPPNRTWGGDINSSWIVFFVNYHNQPQKPEYLQNLFMRWAKDGAL